MAQQQQQQPPLAQIWKNLRDEVEKCGNPDALKGMGVIVNEVELEMAREDSESLEVTYCQILKKWITEKCQRLKQKFDFEEKEKKNLKVGIIAIGAVGALAGAYCGANIAASYGFKVAGTGATVVVGAATGAVVVVSLDGLLSDFRVSAGVGTVLDKAWDEVVKIFKKIFKKLEETHREELRSLLSFEPDFVRWLMALLLHWCKQHNVSLARNVAVLLGSGN